MRKIYILLVLLLSGMACGWAQSDSLWRDTMVEISGEWEVRRIESPKKKDISAILNNLTLPLEAGCAFTPKKGQARPGFYMRTSLEYREFKTTGWCVGIEFDSYTRKYEQENINDVNITKGRDWTIDILAGGGYRVPLVRDIKNYMKRPTYDNIWSMEFMLYAGASCQTMERVAPAGLDQHGVMMYHTETIDSWVPTMKFTTCVEYTICYGISLFVNVGYLQHLQKTRLETDYVGELLTSLGITFFFR